MKIKLKRGLSSNITAVNLDSGEPAFCTDTGKLYVGDGTSNILVNPDGGTAEVANKLAIARSISLTGDATGSTNFDGSANVSIGVTVADDSHNHSISNVGGLQSALDGKQASLGFTPLNANLKGAAGGVAELDVAGKVPASQLPSYVDDVEEHDNQAGFPTTGETGKIYIAKDTNKTYRWSGSGYVEISASIALGTTSSTAFRGDYGQTAYTHSQSAHAPTNAQKNSDITKAEIEAKLTGTITTHSHTVTKGDVGLGNVINESKSTMFTSPTFTGTPKTTTPAKGTNTTQIASTAYVMTALGDYVKTTDTIDGGTF